MRVHVALAEYNDEASGGQAHESKTARRITQTQCGSRKYKETADYTRDQRWLTICPKVSPNTPGKHDESVYGAGNG